MSDPTEPAGSPSPNNTVHPTTVQHAVGYQPVGWISIGLAILTAALWGGTPVAIKYSVDQVPPILVAGIRFGLAAIFMLVWCRFEMSPIRLQRHQIGTVTIGGLLLFAQISLFNLGTQLSNASHSSVLINTFVIWVVLIEHFVLRTDLLSFRKAAGLSLAMFGGLILTATSKSGAAASNIEPTLFGDSLLLASAVLLGIKITVTKQAMKTIAPGQFVFWHDVIGVACFLAYSLIFEPFPTESLSARTVFGLLYQGVMVAGLCFAIQARLLRKHGASRISVFSCSTPVFGILFATLFMGDALSPWLFVAGACVAVGILTVTAVDRSRRIDVG